MTGRQPHPCLASPFRLVVQAVVELQWLRVPQSRPVQVANLLRAQASVTVHGDTGWVLGDTGWVLGEVEYKAEVAVPAGVIPTNRPHELDGCTATEDTLDALIAQLDTTPFHWTVVATAEVIRNV